MQPIENDNQLYVSTQARDRFVTALEAMANMTPPSDENEKLLRDTQIAGMISMKDELNQVIADYMNSKKKV